MAGKIVGWAFEQSCPSPSTKLVLVKLAENSNKAGCCWPKVSTIMRQTGLGERTVRKSLGLLELSGLIRIERRTRGTNLRSNRYQLVLGPVDKPYGKGEVGLSVQATPAMDAPSTGTTCTTIRTVNEPAKNLPLASQCLGDAHAMKARIVALRSKLGTNFDAWFGGAEFGQGQITVPRRSAANWIRRHFSGEIEHIFGSDVQIVSADERRGHERHLKNRSKDR